jgi:phospholipase/lecithinase/hemolysin
VSMQPGIDYPLATTVPVTEQVLSYLTAYGSFTSDQLVLINGGANDIFFQLAVAQAIGTPDAFAIASKAIAQAAVDLVSIVDDLVDNGAAHVVVMNVPNIGQAPLGIASSDHGALLTQVSQLFNTTLAVAFTLHQKEFERKVILIDAFGFIDRVINSFSTYGFSVSNTGTACNLPAQVTIAAGRCPIPANGSLYCTNPTIFGSSLFCSPDTYTAPGADYTFMFADLLHPTTHLNKLFAHFVEQQIAFALHGLVASE